MKKSNLCIFKFTIKWHIFFYIYSVITSEECNYLSSCGDLLQQQEKVKQMKHQQHELKEKLQQKTGELQQAEKDLELIHMHNKRLKVAYDRKLLFVKKEVKCNPSRYKPYQDTKIEPLKGKMYPSDSLHNELPDKKTCKTNIVKIEEDFTHEDLRHMFDVPFATDCV